MILFVKVRRNDSRRQSRICMRSFRILLLKFVCMVFIIRIPTKEGRGRNLPYLVPGTTTLYSLSTSTWYYYCVLCSRTIGNLFHTLVQVYTL